MNSLILEIQIRDALRIEKSFDFNLADFESHNIEIERCVKLQYAILKSKEYYYQIQSFGKIGTKSDLNYEDFIASALIKIEKFIEETNSVQIRYWYYLVAVPFYINVEKNYERAILLQVALIKLVEKEVAIKSKTAIAGTNMQLAHVYLIINRYKESLAPAQKATQTFRKDSFNYLRALEFLFWAYFRTEDLGSADDVIQTAFKHKFIDRSPYFNAKWKYFKSEPDVCQR